MIRIHLSRILGERRWTRKKLAEITHIRPTTISEYYHEMVDRVNLKHMSRICKALGCRIEDLLEFIDDEDDIPGFYDDKDNPPE